MKNYILKSAIFGLIIGFIFSILCINLFGTITTGITLGVCFAIPFFLLGTNLFSKEEKEKNNK